MPRRNPKNTRPSPDIIRKFALFAFVYVLLTSSASMLWAQATETEQNALDEIRAALALRELQQAKQLLENAPQTGTEDFIVQIERLDMIQDYLSQFWSAVDEGARSLNALDEITVGKTKASIVEVENGQIIVRVAGENKRYSFHNMPPKLAVVLAGRTLAKNKQNLVFLATYHLADKSGDRVEAERLLGEAKRSGVAIGTLLDELSADRPAVADIDIPDMTPVMSSLLMPRRWVVLEADGRRVQRRPLDTAEQNTEGRLVIPAADGTRIVAFQTPLAANFGCRVVLQGTSKGQRFGLFSNSDPDKSVAIELPAGTCLIEMARQRGKWQCRLNGQAIEVVSPDDATLRMTGMLGFEQPANSECTVAAIELRTR